MPEDRQPAGPGPQSPAEFPARVTPADAGAATYWIGNLAARKTNTYGAIGIALAVLLWVYILGRIMVASAGLNAALYYRRENRTG